MEAYSIFFFFQFSTFIMTEINAERGRLRPGADADSIIKDMFNNQDSNKDGKITEGELKLKDDDKTEQVRRDEL